VTKFSSTLGNKAASQAALVDLDKCTHLFACHNALVSNLLRKTMGIEEQYQWPIVTALASPVLKPITRLWAGLKRGALPEPIILAFLRDGASYVVERAFNKSDRAWRVVTVLEQRARVNRLSTIAKLREAEEVGHGLYTSCHTVSQQKAVEALCSALAEDPLEGARQMCSKAVRARAALRAPDEGSIVIALSKKLSRLCDKALQQHPQADILRKKI
jgi:hypothetical protein